MYEFIGNMTLIEALILLAIFVIITAIVVPAIV